MQSREPAGLRSSGTLVAIALVLTTLLALAGCGASGDIAIPRPAAGPALTGVPGPGAAPSAAAAPASARSGTASPAGAASAPSGAAVCGPGLWSVIKDHIDNPAVAIVGMVGGCREASIETTLDSSSVATGVAICNKAAEVAYANGVSTITVVAGDARQIAKGAMGSPCTGER